jgi:hypothetical protein
LLLLIFERMVMFLRFEIVLEFRDFL